ncbi:MAG: hypothetical protein U0K28_06955, partial [Prevotellamassilia sp.]|nr:hypothetical protein [Prevotellamassilia sp.]
MEQRLATKKIFLFIECFADKKGFAQTKGFTFASFKNKRVKHERKTPRILLTIGAFCWTFAKLQKRLFLLGFFHVKQP